MSPKSTDPDYAAQFHIIEVNVRRGLTKAQTEQSDYVDLFQHISDELARLKQALKNDRIL